MNIALVFQHKLVQGLRRLLAGTTTRNAMPAHAAMRTTVHAHQPLQTVPPATQRPAPSALPMGGKAMPLRVLHVVERGMPRATTGRLVISGRMADVCAELDRLVAREAALQ